MSRRAPSDNREVDPRVESWMRRAIALAMESQPHPNPRVGAVVMTPEGVEVGAGAHLGPGQDHAEVVALRAAGDQAAGSTVVTTLEPCSHFGRTPPCTDALIAAEVARVIVGCIDPDDRVAGAGIAKLEAAGIEVTSGVLSDEVQNADPGYFHHRRTGRPRFVLKLAATLDGQVAAADGTSQWITSPKARRDAHAMRSRADAVVVGAGTLRADDPLLDVRTEGFAGRQPRPVIVAGQQPLPEARRVYERNPLIFSPQSIHRAGEVVVATGTNGVDLETLAKELATRGLLEVLVEGGPTLATAFLEAGLVDQLTLYLGAKAGGGLGQPLFSAVFDTLADAVPLEITAVTRVGPDVRIDASVTGEA